MVTAIRVAQVEVDVERALVGPSREEETGTPCVVAHMDAQFRRLDAMLAAAEWRAAQRLYQSASAHLEEFVGYLERHLFLEESLVHPLAEQVSQGTAPLAALADSHAEIRRLVRTVRLELARGDGGRASSAFADLRDVLGAHHLLERSQTRRVIDRSLEGREEREALARSLREYP